MSRHEVAPSRRVRPAVALVALLPWLAACGGGGPLVAPGTQVVAEPSLDWVARIAWTDDGDELAFLGTTVGGDLRAFRASLVDAGLDATEVGGFQGASEIRYVPGTRDLIVVGRPSPPPAAACGEAGVVVVRGSAAVAVVGCPFEQPIGVIGRAGIAEVDPDQFVAVHPAATSLAVPSGGGATWVDLATFEERGLGPGYPVAFDPAGGRLVVVELDPADWGRQAWAIVDAELGTRTPLPIAEERFERGFHVIGVRWLPTGLTLLLERDLAEGSEWSTWNLDTDEERVLGPAQEEIGGFPLGRVPRWSASGRLLAFREYVCLRVSFFGCAVPRWSIVVVDIESGERQLAYRGEAFVDVPAIAPDDSAVAFAQGGAIYLKELR